MDNWQSKSLKDVASKTLPVDPRKTPKYEILVRCVAANKFWPTVNKINDVYGRRNLVCSCADMDSYRDFVE